MALFLKGGDHLVCKAPAGVVEVQGDRRSAKRQRVGDEFLRAVVLGGVGAERVAGMGAGRAAIACADFLHLEHLARRDTVSHVAHGATNAYGASLQALVNLLENRVTLFQSRARHAPAALLAGFKSGYGTVQQVIAF